MDLTDEEFDYLHSVFYNHAYYGDDDIVYGNGAEAWMTRQVMAALDIEKINRAQK